MPRVEKGWFGDSGEVSSSILRGHIRDDPAVVSSEEGMGTGRRRTLGPGPTLPYPQSQPSLSQRLIKLLSLILLRVTCISHYYFNSSSTSTSSRLRVRCQISSGKSDFIYIIVLGLCLLFSPAVTPVITSNAILPMDLSVTGKSIGISIM